MRKMNAKSRRLVAMSDKEQHALCSHITFYELRITHGFFRRFTVAKDSIS